MPPHLNPTLPVYSVLRARVPEKVSAVAEQALERLGGNRPLAPLFDRYSYVTVHHFERGERRPIAWSSTPAELAADLAHESRAIIMAAGTHTGAELQLLLNCDAELISQRVGGRRRKVPRSSDNSTAGLSVTATHFDSPDFARAYLMFLADIFQLLDGEYGWAHHLSVRPESDYDLAKRDPFVPSFVTWANYFGPSLVARYGRESLLRSPAHSVYPLPNGSVLLTTCASPLSQVDPGVQETIARVKAHLGILSPSEMATPSELAAFQARRLAAQEAMKGRIEAAFRDVREALAAEMLRQADGCVAGVRQFWREELDFSPGSMAVLDRLIATGFAPDEQQDTIETAIQAFGAYAGETVRRHLGGTWVGAANAPRPTLSGVGPAARPADPFDAVRLRFRDRARPGKHSLVAWCEALSK